MHYPIQSKIILTHMNEQILTTFKTQFLKHLATKDHKLAAAILGQMQLNQPLSKLQNFMRHILDFKKYNQIEKYRCGKDFSVDTEGFAYFCLECGHQCNSMICAGCFDPELHKAHTYYLKDGVRGSCDCGDLSHWNEEGTCNIHSVNGEPEKPINQEEKTKFKRKIDHILYLLHQLYNFLPQYIKTHRVGYRPILKMIDQLGSIFFCTLYKTILNRKTLIELIREILIEKQINNRPAYQLLFSLVQLNQTAQKVVLLLNLIMDKRIDQKQTSRIELTSFYFEHYSELIQSKFTNLSPHLLSNSRTIQEFLSSQKESALLQLTFQPYNRKLKDQIYIHNLFLAYYKYYSHLSYLIELKTEAAAEYWNNFAEKGGFQQFGIHCQAFSQTSFQIKIALSKYYSIQTKFFQTAIQLFTTMSTSDSFLKKAVNEIFVKIKKSQAEEHSNSHNYFRTYRRLMSLGTFLLLGKREGVQKSFIKPQTLQMNRLALILKISKANEAETIRILERQLQMTLQYMLNIPQAMQFKTIRIGEKDCNAFESFQKEYFMKNRLLFSLDVIYFRIILALLTFLRKNKISEEILNEALQKLLDKVKIDDHYSEPKQGMPRHTQISICRFLSLLHEFMFSDQIDLLLSSHFSCFSQNGEYKNRLKQLYSRFFISLSKINTSKLSTKRLSYIEIVEKLMFSDKIILEQLLKQKDFSLHPNSKKKLSPKIVQNFNLQGLNLVQYCPSLYLLLAQYDLANFYSNHTSTTAQNQAECLSSPFASINNLYNGQMADFIKGYIQNMLRQSMNHINDTQIEFQQLWDLSLTLIYKYSQSSNPKSWVQFLHNSESYNLLRQLQHSQSNKIKYYSSLTLCLIEHHKEQQLSQSSSLSQLPQSINPPNAQEIKIDSSLQDRLSNKQIQIPSMIKNDYNQGRLVCPLCNEEQPQENMLILTYLQYKSTPTFLPLPTDLKSMYFQTCRHYINKKCLQQNYSDKKAKKYCLICKRQWNFALPMKYQHHESILQLSSQLIDEQVLKNNQSLKSKEQKYFFELYKSLLVFLATSYHFNSSYYNCEVYKILASLLMEVPNHHMWVQKDRLFAAQKDLIRGIEYISQKLSEWLKIILNPNIQLSANLNQEEISKIDQYIRNFFCQPTQTLLQKTKLNGKQYHSSNLQVLQARYKKCHCKQHQARRGTYLVGLGKKEIVWCFRCFKKTNLGIDTEDQCLILETTRGSLFLATKNDKLVNVLTKIKQKLFVNEIGKTIQELTEEAIRLKIKYDKNQFKIDNKILYEVQRNFHLRLYRPNK